MIPMHVEHRGRAGAPPMILVHGFAASNHSWRHWVPGLSERWELHLVELAGFGRSPVPPDGKMGPLDQARHLGALIREGIDRPVAEAVAEVFLKQLFQESAKRAKAAKAEEATFEAKTAQAVLFGKPEIDYLLDAARSCCAGAADAKAAQAAAEAFFKDRDIRANLAAMKHHAGLEAALFGRMVTSDLVANTDAFTELNLRKVGYAENPLENQALAAYRVVGVPITPTPRPCAPATAAMAPASMTSRTGMSPARALTTSAATAAMVLQATMSILTR